MFSQFIVPLVHKIKYVNMSKILIYLRVIEYRLEVL
jgi:hypothetical protein